MVRFENHPISARVKELVAKLTSRPVVEEKVASLATLSGFCKFMSSMSIAATLGIAPFTADAGTVQTVTITSVVADSTSVKVDFAPVPGAVDYRIFNVADPTEVKYAGQYHHCDIYGNYINTYPSTEIEWNGMTPGQSQTLEVQAVDAQGPFPQGNLYDGNNLPLYPAAMDSMSLLGSNEGETLDGNLSVNGQGSFNSAPQVIAQSAPFTATPTGLVALPSSPNATQVTFDSFASATISAPTVSNFRGGAESFVMTSAFNWDVMTDLADLNNTKFFVMNHHLMDVLFDGGNYNVGDPMHQGHGFLGFSPQPTANFGGGQILHATMEVDAQLTARRWVDFFLSPANDPLTSFDQTMGPVNNTDQALCVQIAPTGYNTDITGRDANGNDTDTAVTSGAGGAPYWTPRTLNSPVFDNRSRFDLFVSQTHMELFENGIRVVNANFPGAGLPFSVAKVYFTHYNYHSAQGVNDLNIYQPYETFWLNDVPYSDERHWNNMGFEVLPSSTSWSSIVNYINETAPIATGTTTGGSGSGSGNSGSGGGNGNGGASTSLSSTVTGTVSSISDAPGQPASVVINGSSPVETVTVTTSDPVISGDLIEACALNETVTVTFTSSTGVISSDGESAAAAAKKVVKGGKVVSVTIKK